MHVLSSWAGVKFNCEKLSVLLLFQDTVHQTREFCKISWADAYSPWRGMEAPTGNPLSKRVLSPGDTKMRDLMYILKALTIQREVEEQARMIRHLEPHVQTEKRGSNGQ